MLWHDDAHTLRLFTSCDALLVFIVDDKWHSLYSDITRV